MSIAQLLGPKGLLSRSRETVSRTFHLFRGDGILALVFRGSAWTLGIFATGQILRVGRNVALAALLFPEAFGLMAIADMFSKGVRMLSDVGFQPNVIRSENADDPRFLNTVWTMQVVRGLLVFGALVALAYPLSRAFALNDPAMGQLAVIMPVAAVGALIAGFHSTSLLMMGREMRLGLRGGIMLTSRVVATAVMIGWAALDPSVWALVSGGIAASIVILALSHRFNTGCDNRFELDRSYAAEILRFGSWIFISTALTFLAMQADRVLLAGLVSLQLLGIYAIAMVAATIPREIFGTLLSSVLLPALARKHRESPDAFHTQVERARRTMLPMAGVCVGGLILFAPAFFHLLYDDRYSDAGWMAQLMAISLWFALLSAFDTQVLLATGDSRSVAASNLANVVVTALAALTGFGAFGVPGFILGFGLGTAAGRLTLAAVCARAGLSSLRVEARHAFLLCASVWILVLASAVMNESVDFVDWRTLVLGSCMFFVALAHAFLALRRATGDTASWRRRENETESDNQ